MRTSTVTAPPPASVTVAPSTPTLALDVQGLSVVKRRRTILSDVNLSIPRGELVAIVGASGAGKSTLLEAIAGIRAPAAGVVWVDGEPRKAGATDRLGYVPQDDLIHRDLPVADTLRYAARLRLPAGVKADEIDRIVARTLQDLELTERAGVRVADLSGGQRKRVSIGVELLTRPCVFFLDEPTSGLDPSTGAQLMATLRRLADDGTTVVLTTHNTEDLAVTDRVVVVAGGTVSFVGRPDEVRRHLGVEAADASARPRGVAQAQAPRLEGPVNREPETSTPIAPAEQPAGRPGVGVQWRALTGRNVQVLRRNRLTLAIMLAAPALVIGMFAMLFRAGALNAEHPDATAAISTTYWMAFAAFFFGLTYGLLQIVTEFAIVRRETFVGVRLSAYLAAKVTVLVPVVAAVDLAMLAVLRGLDRLPALDTSAFARIALTLVVTSVAALALGLLASAAVADPAQATLALPMLCFPAVLFAGAVLPVATMDIGGQVVSVAVIARWSFEAVGHELGLSSLLANDSVGAPLLTRFDGAFDHRTLGSWILLSGFAAVQLLATWEVLRRRTRQ